MANPSLLDRTVDRLRGIPGFMAFELDRYRQVTGASAADEFGVGAESLTVLALCRRARRDVFRDDVRGIAQRAGAPVNIVANLMRALDAVPALANITEEALASEETAAGLLAAARDHAEEHTIFESPWSRDPFLPGWLTGAVDRFWGDDEPSRKFPRDLNLSILLNLPVAIIEMEDLTGGVINEWFEHDNLPELIRIADVPLRGCVTAYAGVGLLFIERTDDLRQRRVTLAHEASHFVLDYLLPRDDVASRRPELLDVLDGQRSLTSAEQFDSLLADVTIGFHTHLLERDPRGGHLFSTTSGVEDRAERMALELLAPLHLVLRASTTTTDALPWLLADRFGLPTDIAGRYARHIAHFRPRSPSTFFDAIGLDENNGTAAADSDD